jgi:Dienelactone hydrolase family
MTAHPNIPVPSMTRTHVGFALMVIFSLMVSVPAWAGRITVPGHAVGPKQVKLFWDGMTTDPEYRLTTDWGAIDAYHSPRRYPANSFQLDPPSENSIDPVASPRNSGWFPCVMAARRAITLLEQQPEVDADKFGIYGHSMGGKLSVLTAGIDKRVKAAAASCGGVSDRSYPDAAYHLPSRARPTASMKISTTPKTASGTMPPPARGATS